MMKLIKHLKPFAIPILISIALLYGQAMADLALPDYMSNIVNIGIQQAGVDHTLPIVMKESDANHLKTFLSSTDKKLVFDHYDFMSSNDPQYKDYSSVYTKLGSSPIYVLKDIDKATKKQLDPIVAKALLSVSGVNKMVEDANGGPIKFGEKNIPAGTDLFALLERLPEQQKKDSMTSATKRFEDMGETMVVQAGAKSLKAFYESLGADMEKIQRNYILYMGAIMLIITLLGAVASIAVGYISAKVAAGLGKNLRKKVFEKVGQFSNIELDQFSTSSLITRSTNDVNQIQNLTVMMIRMVFYAPIIGIGGVIRVMDKSSHMSWIIGVAVALLMIVIGIVFSIALPKFKMIQKLIDKLNLVTRENLSGMMVIRAFNTQAFEEKRFDKANTDLTDTNLFVNRVMTFMFPMMMLIMNGTSLMIVWVGSHQIAESTMQVGDMMAFMQYAMQIIMAFLMLSMMFILIPRASVSAQRIAEVLETDISIEDPESPKTLPSDAKGVIEFKNASFRYPGAEEDMIKALSFKAEPGKMTAIIGSTGSGKTTMINLIPRFYDVTGGQVLMDGIDVRELTQHELRAQVGYIPQKAFLFSGTIESNLKFAKEDATQADMELASEIAQAMEFISEKPDGFATEISQGGSNVSGGQKQRISIARALVKKPKVYIFDDSFSSLDFKTDSSLRKALRDKTGDSTLLIVAQRISTIKNADQIIVLEDGRMVGLGTHQELMATCETYQEIALSQLSKEELS
jgi:ATP-binding cassette subfamily B multidrug efflux pump